MARPPGSWLVRHQLGLFWVVVFALAWAAWIPAAVLQDGGSEQVLGPAGLLALAGAFAPSLAALVLTWLIGGRNALRRLLARLLYWRVGIRWYLLVLCTPALLSLASLGVQRLLGGQVLPGQPLIRQILPPELSTVSLWGLAIPIFIQQMLFSSPMGEEIGWRGYALPRLQSKRSALRASLELGLVWGLWHLPRIWEQYTERPVAVFAGLVAAGVLGTMATAVLFTWVYNSTGCSLLLVLLFHAAYNTTGLLLPATLDLSSLLIGWFVALLVIVWAGPERLCRTGRSTGEPPAHA